MSIEHLQADLILEIFSRLPSKSVARCRCVSKLWASLLTLGSPYFTELFLTQSKTRPRFLFAVQKYDKWLLYSCPQPQNSYKNSHSSLSFTAEFHIPLPKSLNLLTSLPVSGLIYCPNKLRDNTYSCLYCPYKLRRDITDSGLTHPVLFNPSTGQILWLPELKVGKNYWVCSFVRYDPIDKQFTVLSIGYPVDSLVEFRSSYQILTIGSGKELVWRNLECPLQPHIPSYLSTYVNGVLYYVAQLRSSNLSKIVCFDYKSEEFKFIDEPWDLQPNFLVNFKGKLCGIYIDWIDFGERYKLVLSLRVLEDFEKQEWSKRSRNTYLLPGSGWCSEKGKVPFVYVVGVTVTGEIVLRFRNSNPICVLFFNPEKNSLQEVEIEGVGEFKSIVGLTYVDHVEDLRMF